MDPYNDAEFRPFQGRAYRLGGTGVITASPHRLGETALLTAPGTAIASAPEEVVVSDSADSTFSSTERSSSVAKKPHVPEKKRRRLASKQRQDEDDANFARAMEASNDGKKQQDEDDANFTRAMEASNDVDGDGWSFAAMAAAIAASKDRGLLDLEIKNNVEERRPMSTASASASASASAAKAATRATAALAMDELAYSCGVLSRPPAEPAQAAAAAAGGVAPEAPGPAAAPGGTAAPESGGTPADDLAPIVSLSFFFPAVQPPTPLDQLIVHVEQNAHQLVVPAEATVVPAKASYSLDD
jgi:hypothetical protein